MSDDGARPRSESTGRSADRSVAGRLARTARIARWEVSRSTGTIDRKTILVVLAIVAVVGVVGFATAADGLGLEDELYVVGVDEDNPYHDVATESDQFRVVPLADVDIDEDGDDANVDVVVTADGMGYVGDNGEQAIDAFREAIESYNEDKMAEEDDEAAAYPVLVELEYQERSPADAEGATPDAGDAEGTPSGSVNGADGDDERADGTETGDPASGDGEDGEGDETMTSDENETEALQVPDLGGGGSADETAPSAPGALSPPFPFQSLVLAFFFIVPMNFVIQAYGSTIIDERIKRRGELLLVSPASRYEIVAGKTLPYLLGLVAVVVATAAAIGGGVLSVAAAIPIALLFLAATFAGAMLARSFKELTFVTVTISVVLTTYAFIPAIFTDVTPIALISPLTLVVMDLQGDPVALGEYLFSTGPFYLSAAVLFLLGIGIYREEDMFAQKPVPAKLIDAIASQIDAVSRRANAYWSPFALSILFIPFVFAGQLLAVALLFAVPEAFALPVMFVLAAAIEEFAKSIHVYAGFARSRFDSSIRVAVLLGALSGLGFFVGEKLTHAVQLVGLPELGVSVAAFGPAFSSDPLVVVAIFLAPLVLHVVTAVIGALGASRSRSAYALAFVLATLVHAVYNLGVIALVA
ncbi:PrsW family intramembrane metalloprotease [Natrialbaceae archaeon A-arb3/5]